MKRKDKMKDILDEVQTLITNITKEFYEYRQDIQKRDYLINTKFKGEVKNAKLLKELKEIIYEYVYGYSTWVRIGYYTMCKEIQNYEFKSLNKLYNKIMELNEKQKILDTYIKENK